MNKSELILERRHAKYMVDFYKIHRGGSYRASELYQKWLTQYNSLKEKVKNYSK